MKPLNLGRKRGCARLKLLYKNDIIEAQIFKCACEFFDKKKQLQYLCDEHNLLLN